MANELTVRRVKFYPHFKDSKDITGLTKSLNRIRSLSLTEASELIPNCVKDYRLHKQGNCKSYCYFCHEDELMKQEAENKNGP